MSRLCLSVGRESFLSNKLILLKLQGSKGLSMSNDSMMTWWQIEEIRAYNYSRYRLSISLRRGTCPWHLWHRYIKLMQETRSGKFLVPKDHNFLQNLYHYKHKKALKIQNLSYFNYHKVLSQNIRKSIRTNPSIKSVADLMLLIFRQKQLLLIQ